MYAVIRRYNVAPGSTEAIVKKVKESFIPEISQAPGFVGWHLVNPEDGTIVSVSLFEDRATGDASTRLATDWVRQNVPHAIRTAPVIVAGTVVASRTTGEESGTRGASSLVAPSVTAPIADLPRDADATRPRPEA